MPNGTEIISVAAYLTGRPAEQFERRDYDTLQSSDSYRKTRRLNILRSTMLMHYDELRRDIEDGRGLASPRVSRQLEALASDGIEIKSGTTLDSTLRYVNYQITLNLRRCLDKLRAETRREDGIAELGKLFSMPRDYTSAGISKARNVFENNIDRFPWSRFVNWHEESLDELAGLFGLDSDDEFLRKVTEHFCTSDGLPGIRGFAEKPGAVLLVDCENSDPVLLYSAVADCLRDFRRIVLVNDENTSPVWKVFAERCAAVCETDHCDTRRLLSDKSLVDQTLVVKGLQLYYEYGIRRFVLATSDSDIWAFIGNVRAEYLVLGERILVSPVLTEKLKENGIRYILLDDLNFEQGSSLLEAVVRDTLAERKKEIWKMLKNTVLETVRDFKLSIPPEDLNRFTRNLVVEWFG